MVDMYWIFILLLTPSLRSYISCVVCCVFSDSPTATTSLLHYILEADILQKKPQEKKLKSKILLLLLFFRETEPPKNVNRSIAVVKLQRRSEKKSTKVMLAGPQMSQNCVVHASLLWYSIQVTLVMWHRVLFFLTVWRLFIGCTLYPPLFGREFRLQSLVPLKNFTLNEVFSPM